MSEEEICPKCGKKRPKGYPSCPFCGERQEEGEAIPNLEERERIIRRTTLIVILAVGISLLLIAGLVYLLTR